MAINGKSIIPVVATHPGSVLKKELKARSIKHKDFAEAISMPASNLSELINGKRNVTEAIAVKLEEALGIPFQNWMNLQNRYHYVKKCHKELNAGECVKQGDINVNNLKSYHAKHPGELIKKELETRGITQKQLANETGIPSSILNAILNGKRAVTTEYAMLFEAALGIDVDFWLRLQSDYNKQMLKSNPIFMERLKNIRKIVAAL